MGKRRVRKGGRRGGEEGMGKARSEKGRKKGCIEEEGNVRGWKECARE